MPHRLSELQPQHHVATQMRIDGTPTEEICEHLGVEKRTVYLWFSDPLVKIELAAQVNRINELFAEKLAGVALGAIDELKRLASQPAQGPMTHETKLKVIREILDRAAPRKVGRSPLTNLSDDDLVAAAVAIANQVESGRDRAST